MNRYTHEVFSCWKGKAPATVEERFDFYWARMRFFKIKRERAKSPSKRKRYAARMAKAWQLWLANGGEGDVRAGKLWAVIPEIRPVLARWERRRKMAGYGFWVSRRKRKGGGK